MDMDMDTTKKFFTYVLMVVSIISFFSIFEDTEESSHKGKKHKKQRIAVASSGSGSSSMSAFIPAFSFVKKQEIPASSIEEEESDEVKKILGFDDTAKPRYLVNSSLFTDTADQSNYEFDITHSQKINELQQMICDLQSQISQKEQQLLAESNLRREAEENLRLATAEHARMIRALEAELERERQRSNQTADRYSILQQRQYSAFSSPSSAPSFRNSTSSPPPEGTLFGLSSSTVKEIV